MNITITPSAEKFMRRMVRMNGDVPGSGFRLMVSAGGCSGLASEFTVEAAPLAGDVGIDCNGLNVFLSAESRLLLEGFTINFSDTIQESGLTFVNPKASAGSCSSHGSHGSSMPPAIATVAISSIQRKR
ncbi:MAG: HesB/IscA family protein [Burkholderiaceae bacterium]